MKIETAEHPEMKDAPSQTVLPPGYVLDSQWTQAHDGVYVYKWLVVKANGGWYQDRLDVTLDDFLLAAREGSGYIRHLLDVRLEAMVASMERRIAKERWITFPRWIVRVLGLKLPYYLLKYRCRQWLCRHHPKTLGADNGGAERG